MHTFEMIGIGLIWSIIVLSTVTILYWRSNDRSYQNKTSAKDILDERYVNGEINEREYKIIRDSLRV